MVNNTVSTAEPTYSFSCLLGEEEPEPEAAGEAIDILWLVESGESREEREGKEGREGQDMMAREEDCWDFLKEKRWRRTRSLSRVPRRHGRARGWRSRS